MQVDAATKAQEYKVETERTAPDTNQDTYDEFAEVSTRKRERRNTPPKEEQHKKTPHKKQKQRTHTAIIAKKEKQHKQNEITKQTEGYDENTKCILADKGKFKIVKETFPSEINPLGLEVRSEPRSSVIEDDDTKQDIIW